MLPTPTPPPPSHPAAAAPPPGHQNKKGYVFGFVEPTAPDSAVQYSDALVQTSLTAFGGTVKCRKAVQHAVYTEDVDDYTTAYVLEFPSLQAAVDWYNSAAYRAAKQLRLATTEGPLVIVEAADADLTGCRCFCLAFYQVFDPDAWAAYAPLASIAAHGGTSPTVVNLGSTTEATTTAATADGDAVAAVAAVAENDDGYAAAVLVGFPTLAHGRAWIRSYAYRVQRQLRMAATKGPFAIVEGVD